MRALPSAVPGPVESPSWKRQRPLPGSTRPAHGLTAAVCRRIDLTWLFYTKRCEKISLIGTPAWVSVLLGVITVAIPSWAAFGFGLATAATAGLVTCGTYSFITRPTIGDCARIPIFTERGYAMRATTIYPMVVILV
jgi:hypothetical protein